MSSARQIEWEEKFPHKDNTSDEDWEFAHDVIFKVILTASRCEMDFIDTEASRQRGEPVDERTNFYEKRYRLEPEVQEGIDSAGKKVGGKNLNELMDKIFGETSPLYRFVIGEHCKHPTTGEEIPSSSMIYSASQLYDELSWGDDIDGMPGDIREDYSNQKYVNFKRFIDEVIPSLLTESSVDM